MILPDITSEPITHTQLVKYAGASGDFNPIHTVVPKAKAVGLPDCIAHGMLLMGMAGDAVTTWFSRKALDTLHVRFTNMTFPGERLTISGEIKEETDDVINGELTIKNESGDIKLQGSFVVLASS